MITRITTALLLSLALAVPAIADNVYMLGKVRKDGTTFISTVFFYAPEVTTLAMCEKEKRRGHYKRWRYYGHQVVKAHGNGKNVDYLCVSTPITIKRWNPRGAYDYIYHIDLRDDFSLTLFDSYSKCLNRFRQAKEKESRFNFCSYSNQGIRSAPVR